MKGIYGRPFLDVEDLVPFHLLDEEAIDLELAVAPRCNNVWGRQHPDDFINYMKPPENASPRVHQFYENNKRDFQALQNFAKLAYGTYSPTWSVHLADRSQELANKVGPDDYQRRVDDPKLWTRIPGIFPSVQAFLNEGSVFESTGRIVFFITDHYCPTPRHADYPTARSHAGIGFQADAEKEFLWISLKNKNLYVFDEATNTKHQVKARAMWFNALDLHGADPVKEQTWSLRIDGKFKPSFKAMLQKKFG